MLNLLWLATPYNKGVFLINEHIYDEGDSMQSATSYHSCFIECRFCDRICEQLPRGNILSFRVHEHWNGSCEGCMICTQQFPLKINIIWMSVLFSSLVASCFWNWCVHSIKTVEKHFIAESNGKCYHKSFIVHVLIITGRVNIKEMCQQ